MPRPRTRANGAGTVYKRPDGRWCATVTLPGGKRRSRVTRLQREAAAWLAQTKADLQHGALPADTHVTVAEHLERWLQDVVAVGPRYSTYIAYRAACHAHWIPLLGNVKVGSLTRQQVQGAVAALTRQGFAASSINQWRMVLGAGLSYAVELGLARTNAAAKVRCPERVPRQRTLLDRAQAQTLLNAVQGHDYEAAFVLCLTAGLRIGEVLALKWADVDWESGCFWVRGGLTRGKGTTVAGPPKTSSSERRIPLTAWGLAALKRQQTRCRELRLKAGRRWRECDLVCPHPSGRNWSPSSFLPRQWLPAVAATGLPNLRPHDLRHNATTVLLELGVELKVVQEILGHKSAATTLGVYAHTRPEEHREAMARLDRWLEQG